MNFQNAIRINHRGFLKSSKKRFVLVENATRGDTFDVYLVKDVKEIKVYSGKLTAIYEDGKELLERTVSDVVYIGY